MSAGARVGRGRRGKGSPEHELRFAGAAGGGGQRRRQRKRRRELTSGSRARGSGGVRRMTGTTAERSSPARGFLAAGRRRAATAVVATSGGEAPGRWRRGRRVRSHPFPIQFESGKRGEGEGEPERRRRGGRRGEGADAREGIGRGEILSPARCVRACLCVCVVWWRRVRETRGGGDREGKVGRGSLGFGRPRGL